MAEVGPRLRHLRERFNLSQRALAKKAGVPSSSVSLIESGRASPSVGSLKRLLDVVGVSLAEFFSLELPRQETFYYRQAELTEIGRGLLSFRQVGNDLTGKSLQILCETYAPGADTGRIPLSHKGQEGGVIISGRLEVMVDGKKYVLGPGDAYLFPSTLPHRFRNPGEQPCRVVSASTPPSF